MQICGSYRSGIRWVWNSLVIELLEKKKKSVAAAERSIMVGLKAQ